MDTFQNELHKKLTHKGRSYSIGLCDGNDTRIIEAKKILENIPFIDQVISYKNKSPSDLEQAGKSLSKGNVDVVLGGAAATTSSVIRAALNSIGTAPQVKRISGSFLMLPPLPQSGPALIFADCGVNIEPDAALLANIASQSLATRNCLHGLQLNGFKDTNRVAFLSFSSQGSAKHPQAEKIAKATSLFQDLHPNVEACGEAQVDAALIPEIGKIKMPSSKLNGPANILIFPDLNAGNIAYKLVERLAGYTAIGPILQGMAKPFSDLSRGCNTYDIVLAALLNCALTDSF